MLRTKKTWTADVARRTDIWITKSLPQKLLQNGKDKSLKKKKYMNQ